MQKDTKNKEVEIKRITKSGNKKIVIVPKKNSTFEVGDYVQICKIKIEDGLEWKTKNKS